MATAGAPRRRLVLPLVDCETPEIRAWLATLDSCRARTLSVVSGITVQELDRIPSYAGNTIGSLLYHIAAIELDWLYSEILEQEFPADLRGWFPHDVRDPDGKLTTVSGDTIERHQERLAYVRNGLIAALRPMSLSEFRRERRLAAYDVTPEWVLHHLVQHEAEHRGQIAILRSEMPPNQQNGV